MYRKIKTQLLPFVSASGIGFCFDISIFVLLVSFLNFQLFLASVISSCSVACVIFVFSNRKIYHKSQTKILSILLYLTYQIVQIIVVSKVVEIIAELWNSSTGLAVIIGGAAIKVDWFPSRWGQIFLHQSFFH